MMYLLFDEANICKKKKNGSGHKPGAPGGCCPGGCGLCGGGAGGLRGCQMPRSAQMHLGV